MNDKKISDARKFYAALFVLSIATAGTLSYRSAQSTQSTTARAVVASENRAVVYPTLYSDTHITANAIEANPRFTNRDLFDADSLVASAARSVQIGKHAQGTTTKEAQEQGTWLWTPIPDITHDYRDSIIAEAKRNGIRNIYLSIDSYLDIFVMEDGEEKTRAKAHFDGIIEGFIAKARENGITVDAEAGWRNWAERGHSYKAFAVLSYAIEFNKTHDEKFRGFQYDVEPYLLFNYHDDKAAVLRRFINLVSETVTRLDKSDLELSVVIPEFYDGSYGETPLFLYGNKTAYAFDHLLSVLDRRSGSKIIVMAYRNESAGKDGSITISQDEVWNAARTDTKVVLAQETGEVLPPYITFYNTSRSRYDAETAALAAAFAAEKSFAGIATHYINSFLELR